MRRETAIFTPIACVVLLTSGVAHAARDYISIVGSSTVYPFATVVAERFGKATKYRTPKVESTGSGGGLKLFCAGEGVQHPDITNASRRIKKSEVKNCAKHGISEILEVKIGYDGIAIANSREVAQLSLTRKQLFQALAKEVPDPQDPQKLIANPYKTWHDISSDLPVTEIEVLGPPPTSGTRDAFVELVMEEGCDAFPSIKKLKSTDKSRHKVVCQTLREDGAFIEAGENDNLIVQKLSNNPDALGIFGYSFLEQNLDKVQGSLIEGVEPEFEAIANGDYPVSRPLFFYVKKAHINAIPGLLEFVNAFASESAWGDEGYLSERGLIPMPMSERKQFRSDIKNLKPLSL